MLLINAHAESCGVWSCGKCQDLRLMCVLIQQISHTFGDCKSDLQFIGSDQCACLLSSLALPSLVMAKSKLVRLTKPTTTTVGTPVASASGPLRSKLIGAPSMNTTRRPPQHGKTHDAMKLKKQCALVKYKRRLTEILNEDMSLSHARFQKPTIIQVGTDFGGIEGPIICLKRLEIKVGLKFKHVYSNEANKKLRNWTRALSPDCAIDFDACNRVERIPHLDAFVFCPPCQPCASGGKHRGTIDPRGGPCVIASLKLVQERRPALVIFENSPTLLSMKYINVTLGIVRALRANGYKVFVKKIDLAHFVAQRRVRMYLVAIRSDSLVHPFQWPTGSATKILAEDTWCNLVRKSNNPPCKLPVHKRQRCLVKKSCSKLMVRSIDPRSVPCCIDIDCSKSHHTFAVNQHPTLTAARGRTGGAYITTTSSRPGIAALSGVQGYCYRRELKVLQKTCNMSANELGQALGNSVTASFVERLWMRSLKAAGMI